MLSGALLAALSLGPAQVATAVQASGSSAVSASAPVVELAVERRLADSLELSVGDTVRFGVSADGLDRFGVVAAIYQPPPDPATILRRDYRIRLHLPDLAEVAGRPDRIDRIAVRIAPGADPDSVAARLNQTAFGFRAYPSAALASESSRTFAVVSRFHRAIAVITTVASAIFLLCIMLLKVEERRLDAAVMRFIGVRRRTIFGALLLEAAAIAVVGSAMGIVIARVAGAITNRYYQRVFETELIFSLLTPGIVAFGVGLSLLLGLAAGAAAAWRLVRTRPLVLWGRG
jgi:putative ABC transport system permease protein